MKEREGYISLLATHFEVRVAGKRDKMFSFPLKGYMLERRRGRERGR